jgi:hypothetical protein
VTLHVLTAPAGHEGDLARSASGLTTPFHGVAAARAFLAQIPIELGMLPTREPAATLVPYPTAVAVFFAASSVVALLALLLRRDRSPIGLAASPALRLVAVLVPSALLFLFVRHDIVQISLRVLWFPVRGPGFLVFFFAVLAAAALVRALEQGRASRLLTIVVAGAALAIAAERSAVLRVHFTAFDAQVRAFFRGEATDRYLRNQPFTYNDHIRVYNCYFEDACRDYSRLFFSIYPDATLYPVSKVRPRARNDRPAEPDRSSTTHLPRLQSRTCVPWGRRRARRQA